MKDFIWNCLFASLFLKQIVQQNWDELIKYFRFCHFFFFFQKKIKHLQSTAAIQDPASHTDLSRAALKSWVGFLLLSPGPPVPMLPLRAPSCWLVGAAGLGVLTCREMDMSVSWVPFCFELHSCSSSAENDEVQQLWEALWLWLCDTGGGGRDHSLSSINHRLLSRQWFYTCVILRVSETGNKFREWFLKTRFSFFILFDHLQEEGNEVQELF